MLKRLTITMKDGKQVYRDFPEDEKELQEYLKEVSAKGNWGKGEHEVEDKPAVRSDKPPYDIIQPATFKKVPAEFTYTIEPVRDPVESVSPRQIRLALLSLGITESFVDEAINTLKSPDKEMAMIAWKFSTQFERNVPIISAIGQILKLNEDQLDQVWKLGATL